MCMEQSLDGVYVFYLIATNRQIYAVESARAVPPDVNVIVDVVTADTNGVAPTASAVVAELPGCDTTDGADDVHTAPNVTVNSVALMVVVVPVVNVTVKP